MQKNECKKTVIVTGARKGIGRQLAEQYLKEGWYVIGVSRQASDLVDPNYTHECMDVCDENAVKKLCFEIKKTHKVVDALINNAGVASMNLLMITPTETVDRIFRTNFLGTFICCREVAKLMKRNKGGRIVNFSTVAVPLLLEGEAIYASSKAAIETFTKIFAKEVGALGITVNAVGPTPVDTDLIRNVPAEKIKALLDVQSIKRMGTVNDVKNVIDFFLSEKSNFVTGQVVYLGGLSR